MPTSGCPRLSATTRTIFAPPQRLDSAVRVHPVHDELDALPDVLTGGGRRPRKRRMTPTFTGSTANAAVVDTSRTRSKKIHTPITTRVSCNTSFFNRVGAVSRFPFSFKALYLWVMLFGLDHHCTVKMSVTVTRTRRVNVFGCRLRETGPVFQCDKRRQSTLSGRSSFMRMDVMARNRDDGVKVKPVPPESQANPVIIFTDCQASFESSLRNGARSQLFPLRRMKIADTAVRLEKAYLVSPTETALCNHLTASTTEARMLSSVSSCPTREAQALRTYIFRHVVVLTRLGIWIQQSIPMQFMDDEIGNGSLNVQRRCRGDGAAAHVYLHCNVIDMGHITNFLGFCETATKADIRLYNVQ